MTNEEILKKNKITSAIYGGETIQEFEKMMNIARIEERKKMESSPAPALTEEDLKWLIFYGHNKDKSIVIDSEDTRQLDYAITQMFLMMKDSSRFDADGCEKLLWRRISLLLSNSREGKDGEGWIRLRNPEPEVQVLFLTDLGYVSRGFLSEQRIWTETFTGCVFYNVIGWQPLPSPPKTQKP